MLLLSFGTRRFDSSIAAVQGDGSCQGFQVCMRTRGRGGGDLPPSSSRGERESERERETLYLLWLLPQSKAKQRHCTFVSATVASGDCLAT